MASNRSIRDYYPLLETPRPPTDLLAPDAAIPAAIGPQGQSSGVEETPASTPAAGQTSASRSKKSRASPAGGKRDVIKKPEMFKKLLA